MIIIDIVEEYGTQSEPTGRNKMGFKTYQAGAFDPLYAAVSQYHQGLLKETSKTRQLAEAQNGRAARPDPARRKMTFLASMIRFTRRYAQALASWL